MFHTVLIDNRGEIACRVIRTLKRLGIRSVAVYSEADRHSRHVLDAAAAICIVPPPAKQRYLNAEAVLDAALQSGAEAVHPGYGFLSENADFAQACADAGIVFVGPPADGWKSNPASVVIFRSMILNRVRASCPAWPWSPKSPSERFTSE